MTTTTKIETKIIILDLDKETAAATAGEVLTARTIAPMTMTEVTALTTRTTSPLGTIEKSM